MASQTLYDKLWQSHCVISEDSGESLLYIDRHILHEVTSAQAFEGLREHNRQVWRPDSLLATPDHQVPTTRRHLGLEGIQDPVARIQVKTLDDNCKQHNIQQFDIDDKRQGIVHVVAPEQGATLPGMTVVCGDSHTSTHGAFATLAQGIGTSEVEHVLATQCLVQSKTKSMRITVSGQLHSLVNAKDVALHVIAVLGVNGANGYTVEYAGEAVHGMSMEGRMTLCNMTIEMGSPSGMVAFDEVTARYLHNKPFSPKGAQWSEAMAYWQTLHSDPDACFDKEVFIDATEIKPAITWGTKPDQSVNVGHPIPGLDEAGDKVTRSDWQAAMEYMAVSSGQQMSEYKLDQVFIGSCTNGRLEDLKQVAEIVAGHHVSPSIQRALIVPGSGLVKQQAEALGLDRIFKAAGFEWRAPGCSMCNAMNPDFLAPGQRCASTSNRNFEGRQGAQGRTHLVSPAMAAAAAIKGYFVDVTRWHEELTCTLS